MLNRQQETVMLSSSSSSSSRRQNLPRHQNQDRSIKPIGCLSGILHLVSNYHRRRRKFLTFGKKQGKNCDVELPIKSSSLTEEADHNKVLSEGNQISSSSSTTTTMMKKKEDGGGERRHCHVWRLSFQVPRSPTLPSEIRHWDSDVISPENFRGLTLRDGGSTTTTPSPPTLNRVDEKVVEKEIYRSSAEEKRRKLLGALEKCDEDLKAIKNIIDALRTSAVAAEHRRGVKSPTSEEKFEVSCTVEEINLKMKDKGCTEFKHSPISVLDNFISPPLNLDTTSCFSKRHITKGQMVPQQKPQPRKNPREEDTITGTSFFHRVTTIGVSVPIKHEIAAWSSKAVGESVVEVCNDMDCGESREVTRIGLVLQDCILRDLVDQVVKELVIVGRAAAGNCLYSLLPLDACKKRLRF